VYLVYSIPYWEDLARKGLINRFDPTYYKSPYAMLNTVVRTDVLRRLISAAAQGSASVDSGRLGLLAEFMQVPGFEVITTWQARFWARTGRL